MRSFLLTGMSLALTAAVVGNAYYQKQQFYPSVVYITKSNPSMAVMYIQALVIVVLTGKILRALFFGQLRDAEMEHLIERSWYAVTETCLAFTVFRDDFSPRFVALFTLLLFLKCFHWLAEDRIDYMERSPAISWLFHLRALSLIFLLGFLDVMFVRHAFYSTIAKGPSVQLVFGFEYAILLTVVMMIFIKYILHTLDLQNQNPWDNKAVYLLYSELFMGLIRVILYVAFVFIMIKVHTFPLFAIRPMYLTVRAFQKAAQDVILSRRAIRNMNTLYPDATPEELASGDNVCIICREDMLEGCKKLPCNHIFHTACLRSWFQRQQTCPTCRLEVLRMPRPTQQQNNQQQQQPAQQAEAQPQPDQQNLFNNRQGMMGGFFYQWPNAGAQAGHVPPPFQPGQVPPPFQAGQVPPPFQAGQVPPPFGWPPHPPHPLGQGEQGAAPPQAATPQEQAASSSATASTTSSPPPSSSPSSPHLASTPPPFPGHMPPFMPPMGMSPMGMMPPMFPQMGFPPPPVPMSGLSEEELQAMEGVERENVEARIQWLRDIQALLDGAMLLINQYNTIASQMGMMNISTTTPVPPASTSSSAKPSSSSSSLPTATVGARWWPEGTGARPKYSSTVSATNTTDSSDRGRQRSSNSMSNSRDSPVEGATGGETVEEIPHWEGEEGQDEDRNEVRKRRIQHFSQQNSSEGGKEE